MREAMLSPSKDKIWLRIVQKMVGEATLSSKDKIWLRIVQKRVREATLSSKNKIWLRMVQKRVRKERQNMAENGAEEGA